MGLTWEAEVEVEINLQRGSDPDPLKKYSPIGSVNFHSIAFSDNSKRRDFKEHSKFTEKKTAKESKERPLRDDLTLIKLSKDKKKTFEDVISYSFNGKGLIFSKLQSKGKIKSPRFRWNNAWSWVASGSAGKIIIAEYVVNSSF